MKLTGPMSDSQYARLLGVDRKILRNAKWGMQQEYEELVIASAVTRATSAESITPSPVRVCASAFASVVCHGT